MARLADAHKRLIVQRLATFASPTSIQGELQELGIEVSLSQIAYYDPGSRGTDLAQEWRDLFEATRQKFTADTSEIAISHRAFRLRELGRLYQKVTDGGRPNVPLAKELLIEAEKFAGDAYVNARANSPAAETEEERVQRMRAAFAAMDEATLGMSAPAAATGPTLVRSSGDAAA